jgi:hypothetical protein
MLPKIEADAARLMLWSTPTARPVPVLKLTASLEFFDISPPDSPLSKGMLDEVLRDANGAETDETPDDEGFRWFP